MGNLQYNNGGKCYYRVAIAIRNQKRGESLRKTTNEGELRDHSEGAKSNQ